MKINLSLGLVFFRRDIIAQFIGLGGTYVTVYNARTCRRRRCRILPYADSVHVRLNRRAPWES